MDLTRVAAVKNATLRQLNVFETPSPATSAFRARPRSCTSPSRPSRRRSRSSRSTPGLPLFEQLGKKIHLTAAGAAAAAVTAARSSSNSSEAEEAMAQFKGVSGGRLNVAVISAGDYFFPRLLVEFAQPPPGRHAQLRACTTARSCWRSSHENVTDLAMMVRPPDDIDMVDRAVRAAPLRDRRARRRTRSPAASASRSRACCREPFVVREKGSDTWNSMRGGFGDEPGRLTSRWRSAAPRRSSRR